MRSSNRMTRREFTTLAATSSTALAAGCATNPVTGEKQFMLVSQAMEVNFDRKWAGHQFSSDYGAVQDESLNEYIRSLGHEMAALTHRPSMPYNFRALNTVVVNAYTMPAGSIGLARGLLLELENEAQMTAIIGHELGHVNRRHAAERISKSWLLNALIAGGAAYLEHRGKKYAGLAAGLGTIGANMLLCKYSRDNEREADVSGMEYSARAGQNPKGMQEVMEIFMSLNKHKPSTVDLLFATHPMSDERYANASRELSEKYSDISNRPRNRERYMDYTAGLRAMKKPINEMQKGEKAMYAGKHTEAEQHFSAALVMAPEDYACLLLMAKCLMAQEKIQAAHSYIDRAKSLYPQEAQALHLAGMAGMKSGNFGNALSDFTEYEKRLPGNPNTIFYKGLCREKMGHKKQAAEEYIRYHNTAPGGEFAGYAQQNLVKWGYIAPPQEKK